MNKRTVIGMVLLIVTFAGTWSISRLLALDTYWTLLMGMTIAWLVSMFVNGDFYKKVD